MISEIYLQIYKNKQQGEEYLNKAICLIEDILENNYLLSEREKGLLKQRLASLYDSICEIHH